MTSADELRTRCDHFGAGCRLGTRRLTAWSAAVVLGFACDDETPRPALPEAVSVADDSGSLAIDPATLALRLMGTDVAPKLTSAPRALLEFGAARDTIENFHSVLEPDPAGIEWSAVHAVASPSEASLELGDGDRRAAWLELDQPAAGTYRMHVSTHAEDVVLLRLSFQVDDGIYTGLGERFDGPDARGFVVPMYFALAAEKSGTNEHHVPVPFWVSSRGYGVFAKTRATGAFDIAASDDQEVRLTFEAADLEILFFVDPDPRQVVAMYAQAAGLARLPPRWTFAPMHWRNEWESRDELVTEAETIRALGVPCSTLWIDNPWETSYNDLTWDEERFPDPEGMLAALRDLGFLPLLWNAPYLDATGADDPADNPAEELYEQALDEGWIVEFFGAPHISPVSPGDPGGMVDFTSTRAREVWKARIDPLVEMGVRGFKLDYGEDVAPELFGLPAEFTFADGRTEREVHQEYPLLYHAPYRAALDELAGDDGGFLLVRGSSWGGQTIADIVWPGDLDNDFRTAEGNEVGGLPAAVSAVQTLGASGFPAFGSDIGGFRGGMPEREPLLRWAEHSAFTPIMQLGGGGEHHNAWLYDEEAGEIYRSLAVHHMRLVPYLRMNAVRASTTGYPAVVPVALAYPEDTDAGSDPNAYMLGDDLLVAPVVAASATKREVALPNGHWVHWITRESFDGPATITVDAPIGTPPVFARAGSLIPLLAEDVQTLLPAEDVNDPVDFPELYVVAIPAGDRTIDTEEGVRVRVARVESGVDVEVTSVDAHNHDVRLEILWADAVPEWVQPTSVNVNGEALARTSALDDVRGGCSDACWIADESSVWISVRTTSTVTAALR